MINLKNAKEVKKKVEEIKKKNVKKEKIHLESNNCRLAKKLVRLAILLEYVACTIIVLTVQVINLNEEHDSLQSTILEQQNTIYNLSLTLNHESSKYQSATIIKEEKKIKYNISAEDRELMAKLLYHEARGESIECQKAVVSVIINRLNSGKWGNTLTDVIYAKNQFEPVARGLIKGTVPTNTQYQAIDFVLENGVTIDEDVLYFRAGYYFSWGKPYLNLDNTYFSK